MSIASCRRDAFLGECSSAGAVIRSGFDDRMIILARSINGWLIHSFPLFLPVKGNFRDYKEEISHEMTRETVKAVPANMARGLMPGVYCRFLIQLNTANPSLLV